VSVPIRGVPEQTHGVDFVAARNGGLVCISTTGDVYRIVRGESGGWQVWSLRVVRSRLIWVGWTRRSCVRLVVGIYRPATVSP